MVYVIEISIQIDIDVYIAFKIDTLHRTYVGV